VNPIATLHNLDLEASVLGGILQNPGILPRLELGVPDFFSPKHQAVFAAMRNLDARAEPLELGLLEVELRRMGRLEAIGGFAFLGELSLRGPSADNVERFHVRELVGYRAKREVAAALSEALARVQSSESLTASEAMGEVLKLLGGIQLGSKNPMVRLGKLMLDEWGSVEHDLVAMDAGEHVGGMPTGLDKLDALTGGVPRGSVTLVLGETGHGKSTLAMSMARACADQAGDQPLVFSYEDGGRRFGQRGLAQNSGVATQTIRRRSFRPGEMRQLAQALKVVGRRNELVGKVRGWDVTELCTLVRRLRARGPDAGSKTIGNMVIVDYLQAMPVPRARHVQSKREGFAEIALALEDLAADLDVAVVLFSQVNDEPNNGRNGDHRPTLRDGAEGRDAAKGAKLVLGLYRPSLYDTNADPMVGEILVLKNNDGEMRKRAEVYLDLATHTIRDCAPTVGQQPQSEIPLEEPRYDH
jgi:replicative DNA helicase